MMKFFGALFLVAATVPSTLLAAHFNEAYIDLRLVGSDSLWIDVSADHNDMMNTVGVFPYEDQKKESYLAYQARIEAYLQSRMIVTVDGKRVRLSVVRWKPMGKGRDDGFDSTSIRQSPHQITLGGLLPQTRKILEVKTDFWVERSDIPPYITAKYSLFEKNTLLRQYWARMEAKVRFPVHPDSIATMLRHPPVPFPSTLGEPEDHSGHED